MTKFKQWLPILITIAGTVIAALTPAVQDFWSKHPETTTVIAGVWALIKGLLPSPVVQNNNTK